MGEKYVSCSMEFGGSMGDMLKQRFGRMPLHYRKETASQNIDKIIVILVFRPQLLILCNKQDLGTAKGATLIQVSLLQYSQYTVYVLIFLIFYYYYPAQLL